MPIETLLGVVCLVLGIICCVGYRWCTENVYLKYKDQKVGK